MDRIEESNSKSKVMDLKEIDSNLATAVQRSKQTGTTTPILKEVLRLHIQTSRLAKGKKELPKTEFKKPIQHPLTEEEERRRDVRRESNRKAARKCREKKKNLGEEAQESLREELRRKEKLERMVQVLTQQKRELEDKLGFAVEVEVEAKKRRLDKGVMSVGKFGKGQLSNTHFRASSPQDVSAPLDICTSRDFDPVLSYTSRDFDPVLSNTSPNLLRSRNRRVSAPATISFSQMLAESQTPTPPQPSFTELNLFESPPADPQASPYQPSHNLPVDPLALPYQPPINLQADLQAMPYQPSHDFLAESLSCDALRPGSSMALPPPYDSTAIFTDSQPATPLHISAEPPQQGLPTAQSPYTPGPTMDMAMSPGSEWFRPKSPPVFPPAWSSTNHANEAISPLPMESSSFQSCLVASLFNSDPSPPEQLMSEVSQLTGDVQLYNIPSTVFETLKKDTTNTHKYEDVARADQNQALCTDDELMSSQESELLTLYGE